VTQTSALAGKGKKPCRGLQGEGVVEGCRAETLLFIRAIICQPGVAGILFKTSRAYITRGSGEEADE